MFRCPSSAFLQCIRTEVEAAGGSYRHVSVLALLWCTLEFSSPFLSMMHFFILARPPFQFLTSALPGIGNQSTTLLQEKLRVFSVASKVSHTNRP